MAVETKRVYRLPPCPGYDVEGTESWLSDLSAEGLFLTEDGFFCGLGSFERRTPRRMRYRLEAAPKQIGTFSANGYQPDADAVALSEAFGWEYVADRDQFFIYRTADPNARELNTDPQVQALALAAVSRRERSSGLATLVCLLIYPLAGIRGNLLLPMLDGGTWYILFSFAMLTWMLARSLAHSLHLRRLRRRLQQQGQLDHRRPWRPRPLLERPACPACHPLDRKHRHHPAGRPRAQRRLLRGLLRNALDLGRPRGGAGAVAPVPPAGEI